MCFADVYKTGEDKVAEMNSGYAHACSHLDDLKKRNLCLPEHSLKQVYRYH